MIASTLSGCGSASLVLEAPLSDQCTDTGLRGCEQLTKGVLLYVEGKKPEGEEKIRRGTAQSAPEDLHRHAALVRTPAELPGASTRHGVGKAPTDQPAWCGGSLGGSVRCRARPHGPLYVSHVFGTGAHCEGQSTAVIRHGKRWLHVENAEALRGTRIAIEKSDTLVLVQRQKPLKGSESKRAKDTGAVELEESDPRLSCDVYWSGFAPYGTSPATAVDVEVLLDY